MFWHNDLFGWVSSILTSSGFLSREGVFWCTHLFGWVFWHEGGDDQVYKPVFSQDVEDHEVAMADRTRPVLHFVHRRLKVQNKDLVKELNSRVKLESHLGIYSGCQGKTYS